MYHYTESGLSNVYLVNGFTVEVEDGEEFTSIDDAHGLHKAIAMAIVDGKRPMTHEEFKFLRIELNQSQSALAKRFGVNEQTIARYEKGQTSIPRTTDFCLRQLYTESLDRSSSLGYFLELLADAEAQAAAVEIRMQEVEDHWEIAA
ncbi:Helix-turn-helix [Colwellia chukchiensis]|uniref:Helix-turn-helix n=1 Tax=Colwellia chukchiensis TaxID=641665 RepID=A0A1H7U094_9GAMM|nr:helix-turn-helix domain-containing protein [Colwellia chukchiensis]SEL90108.1 Helix-turn-helix [Colwellia chukchiensis]